MGVSAVVAATLLSLLHHSQATSVRRLPDAAAFNKTTIQMIGYSPQMVDDYVAVSMPVTNPGYIVGFEPVANADRVHHMLLYGCEEPANNYNNFWSGQATCGYGASFILYAWARNAPNLNLPQDVAFSAGFPTDKIKYFVLQVHYAAPFAGNTRDFSGVTMHMSQKRPANFAAVHLFVNGYPIPPKNPAFHTMVSCEFTSKTPIHPFAFRTHTHAMGRVVSAYVKQEGKWNKIGKRNPQWPQLFESIPFSMTIKKGDLMASSCRFDSSNTTKWTPMGAMGTDEMCNFYMMFYWKADDENPYPEGSMCGARERENESTKEYPQEGYELLPARPELEHHAHQSSVPFGVKSEQSYAKLGDVELGQISGLSFDGDGNLVVFHRADRVWDASTFDPQNVLQTKTAISAPVILTVKMDADGKATVLEKMGAGQFYLPHGILFDKQSGDVFTTDVGAHTVARWKKSGGALSNVWTSGVSLSPGGDRTHYCKPTAVVRLGERLFVSDGYCNARVVELTMDGKRKNEWGANGDGRAQFLLPHDIVATARSTLMVADRENGRVQELTMSGDYRDQFHWPGLFSNVYSADASGDYVYMVPGDVRMQGHSLAIYVGRIGTGLIEFALAPKDKAFGRPHVVRMCPTGDHIFVGDISDGTPLLWRFEIQHEPRKTAPHAAMGGGGGGGGMAALGSSVANVTTTIKQSGFVNKLLMILLIGSSFGALFWYAKKRSARTPQMLFDRKGFKPLSTDEATVGFIGSESDSD